MYLVRGGVAAYFVFVSDVRGLFRALRVRKWAYLGLGSEPKRNGLGLGLGSEPKRNEMHH